MTDERHSEPLGERQAERDSQLSAMFDGELPGGECELLARRLTRDEALRAQWSRYSMIGAALRAERGVALHDRVAWRVQSAIAQEPTYGEGMVGEPTTRTAAATTSGRATRRSWASFAYPVAGASIAAGVAAVSIFWLRGIEPQTEGLQASTTAPTTIVLAPEAATGSDPATTVALNSAPEAVPSNGEPASYNTPQPSSSTSLAPPARLANYVVAHSEYSGPLTRRMALLGIVGAESGEGLAVVDETAPSDANTRAAEEVDAP